MTGKSNDGSDPLVVRLDGNVDMEHSAAIRECLLGSVAEGRNVVVDLCAVDYMDSSGIASLVEALQETRKRGTEFRLTVTDNQAWRALRLAKLDKVFNIDAGSANS